MSSVGSDLHGMITGGRMEIRLTCLQLLRPLLKGRKNRRRNAVPLPPRLGYRTFFSNRKKRRKRRKVPERKATVYHAVAGDLYSQYNHSRKSAVATIALLGKISPQQPRQNVSREHNLPGQRRRSAVLTFQSGYGSYDSRAQRSACQHQR